MAGETLGSHREAGLEPAPGRGRAKVTCAAQVWDLITAKAGSKPSPVLVWGWGSQVTPTLGGGQGLTVGRGAPFILDNTQPSHLGLVEGSGMLLPSLVEEGILPEGPRSFLQPLGSGGVVGRHLSGVLRGACSCPGPEPCVQLRRITSQDLEGGLGDTNGCRAIGGHRAGTLKPHQYQRQATPSLHLVPLPLM